MSFGFHGFDQNQSHSCRDGAGDAFGPGNSPDFGDIAGMLMGNRGMSRGFNQPGDNECLPPMELSNGGNPDFAGFASDLGQLWNNIVNSNGNPGNVLGSAFQALESITSRAADSGMFDRIAANGSQCARRAARPLMGPFMDRR